MGYFLSAGFSLIGSLLFIVGFGFTIYIYVLMIKLGRRGIRALDLYIAEKEREIRY